MVNMGNPSNQLEIEVKFFLPDLNRVRDKVVGVKRCDHSPVFETNIRYDNDTENLRRNNCLLRLRKDSRNRLTYKSPSREPIYDNRQFKVFRELEVEISDFDTMHEILTAIGFYQAQIYEKKRETFHWNGCHLCFDTIPFGDFLEIEGDENRIRQTSELLGLEWSKRIITNYLAIFETLRKKNGWTFSDLTFTNFKNVVFNFSRYADMFEASALD